jgi:hypothetical protein
LRRSATSVAASRRQLRGHACAAAAAAASSDEDSDVEAESLTGERLEEATAPDSTEEEPCRVAFRPLRVYATSAQLWQTLTSYERWDEVMPGVVRAAAADGAEPLLR